MKFLKSKLFLVLGILVILGAIGFAFLAGVGITETQYKNVPQVYTGQELLDAVNSYRKENGLTELTTSQVICDNLVERWLAITEPNAGHKGYEEWVTGEGIDKEYLPVAELYVLNTNEPANAIEFWTGSPGHKTTLLEPSYNSGCAYAAQQTGEEKGVAGVVILGKKIVK